MHGDLTFYGGLAGVWWNRESRHFGEAEPRQASKAIAQPREPNSF